MEDWRPYSRMASQGVHASAHGGYWDLGFYPEFEAIPAGASHFGLADPAAHSLLALAQVTVALLSHVVRMDNSESRDLGETLVEHVVALAQMKALDILAGEVGQLLSTFRRTRRPWSPLWAIHLKFGRGWERFGE